MRRASTLAALVAATAMALFTASPALAQDGPDEETWFLTLDGSLLLPVGDNFGTDAYGAGFYGGLGLYHSFNQWMAGGVRAHWGFLDPSDEFDNIGGADGLDKLGIQFYTVAMRFRPFASGDDYARATGFWAEVGAGLAVIDDGLFLDGEPDPGFEFGVGWNFEAGPIGVGPSVRFLHSITGQDNLVQSEEDSSIADFMMLAIGAEVVFLDNREPDPVYVPTPPPNEPVPPVVTTPPTRRPPPLFDKDVLIVDETVFFDYDKAELRADGKEKLDEIVDYWEDDGDDWDFLRIQGHADERGPEGYNIDLSRRRSEAVAAYLVSKGVPAAKLNVEAYGESKPTVPDAMTEAEYQANRRVEFRIVRFEEE